MTEGRPKFQHAPEVSFDEIDYRNPQDLKAAQESMLKEQFVRVEMVKMVRKALETCFKVNGPNGYEECRNLADKYMDMLPDYRAQGYLGYQRNDPTK
ncbi:DEKNAAC102596 [Brettanomyces naardenensis]|uniref:DEKNAAC102596 n=1 Tax=Brettanomyces naardenensis TaxID=13370 RepID=A0A448YK16_BRENA|nr:DEKNAAC102596 [Brettanomyces naardenensis]